MQLAAFLCVICAICERIFTQEYSSYHQRKYPNVSRWFTQAPPNKSNNLNEILCEIMQLCCIPLRDLRYLRENNHARVLKLSQGNHNVSRWFTQTKPKTTRTTNCLSLRNNAACCIPLRDLRHLRENKYARVLHQSTKEPPISPADFADYADKTQNHNNITNCLSLRYNAACCIPLRNLRYLRENIHARVLKLSPKKPQCLPLISLIHADKALITTTTTNCLSLRNNAALLHSSA